MSYDIWLEHPVSGAPLEADEQHQIRGGTYVLGGTFELALNITYNYAPHFYRTLGEDGIRSIYGRTGAETIPVLLEAASKLGDNTDPDYWQPTEGNAKTALLQLVALARLRPDGVWRGD